MRHMTLLAACPISEGISLEGTGAPLIQRAGFLCYVTELSDIKAVDLCVHCINFIEKAYYNKSPFAYCMLICHFREGYKKYLKEFTKASFYELVTPCYCVQ